MPGGGPHPCPAGLRCSGQVPGFCLLPSLNICAAACPCLPLPNGHPPVPPMIIPRVAGRRRHDLRTPLTLLPCTPLAGADARLARRNPANDCRRRHGQAAGLPQLPGRQVRPPRQRGSDVCVVAPPETACAHAHLPAASLLFPPAAALAWLPPWLQPLLAVPPEQLQELATQRGADISLLMPCGSGVSAAFVKWTPCF